MTVLRNYLSLVVFAHTIFAMPFALIGFFLGISYFSYPFEWVDLLLVIASMVLARNTAMGFNRWADRIIDRRNPRTAGREIPTGIISGKSALIFTLINALLFMVAAGFINRLCLALSPLALLIIMGYSYTKRFTRWCHLVLGLGLSIAPVGAFLAVTGKFDWLPFVLGGIVLTWVSGFDIIYATQDVEFDQSNQLRSIPASFGARRGLRISMILHGFTAVLLFLFGWMAGFGILYFVGSLLFFGLLIYQHTIISATNLSRVNRAFGTTNGIASVIFAAFVLAELFSR